MPKGLKPFYLIELRNYKSELKKSNLSSAWHHLERAHIIGQKYPYQHSYVHWKMLLFGFKTKSRKEILGQIPRLILGGIFSFIGKVPDGNPGGSNVPPLKPFPIDKELKDILSKTTEQ